MKDVSTAYHNANKADTRSSDFLIVSDTGFSLNKINNSSGWSKKTSIDGSIAMYHCSTETNENITYYGFIEFSDYYNSVKSIEPTPGICVRFEDCYPTDINFYVYNSDNTYIKSASLNNDSPLLQIPYETLVSNIGTPSSLYKVRIYFTKWSKQGVCPVILFATYGEPTVFTQKDLLSVDITLETDPTALSIPYNSYACSVIDENDAYNPLIQDSKIYQFYDNQKFRFYNFEKGFNSDDIISDDLSLFDYEICPVGTAYFKDTQQQGPVVSFNFIDIVEKYDNIHLSTEELELSSHFIKRNVKDYLETLFGADLDTSSVPTNLKAITPFYTESKIQILLYMSQLMQKYIYVTASGILSFREQSDFTEDFCIELAQSYQNPVIEKIHKDNGVEVNAYDYALSQTPESATNRIEFIFDGKTKFYYDGTTYRDAETDAEFKDPTEGSLSFIFPRYDFKELTMRYKYNDVYDRDTVFGTFLTTSVYMSDVKEKFHGVSLDIGTGTGAMVNFIYCDVHTDFTIKLKVPITATDSNGNTTEEYKNLIEALLVPMFMLNELQGRKVISSTNTVKRKKYSSDDSSSAVVIDNPVIAELDTATTVRDWIYSQSEYSAFSIDTDWRGDCSLEIGDDSTAEIAITQNGVKNYENKYIGTVVKNVIEYNGALKMQTTLYASSQKRWNDTLLCGTKIIASSTLTI